jgi:hypothetical protein
VASDYPGRTVLVGYFIENQEAGTVAERQQFSNDLFDAFNAHIVTACAAATPPLDPTPRIRASIALMAQHAKGSNNKIKAGRAVQAYLEFRGF